MHLTTYIQLKIPMMPFYPEVKQLHILSIIQSCKTRKLTADISHHWLLECDKLWWREMLLEVPIRYVWSEWEVYTVARRDWWRWGEEWLTLLDATVRKELFDKVTWHPCDPDRREDDAYRYLGVKSSMRQSRICSNSEAGTWLLHLRDNKEASLPKMKTRRKLFF